MHLVGDELRKVDRGSRDYVEVSEFENVTKEKFNTKPNVQTRLLRVSGGGPEFRVVAIEHSQNRQCKRPGVD